MAMIARVHQSAYDLTKTLLHHAARTIRNLDGPSFRPESQYSFSDANRFRFIN